MFRSAGPAWAFILRALADRSVSTLLPSFHRRSQAGISYSGPRSGFHTTSPAGLSYGSPRPGLRATDPIRTFLSRATATARLLCDGPQPGTQSVGFGCGFIWRPVGPLVGPGRFFIRQSPAKPSVGPGGPLSGFHTSSPSWVFVCRTQPDCGENAHRLW